MVHCDSGTAMPRQYRSCLKGGIWPSAPTEAHLRSQAAPAAGDVGPPENLLAQAARRRESPCR
jgi:hypothetical protein